MRIHRHRARRLAAAGGIGFLAVLSALALAACSGQSDEELARFFPTAQESAPATAEPAVAAPAQTPPTLDLSVAPRTALEAVNTFFALIAAERFDEAYRLVSLEVREQLSQEQFAQRYRDIWEEATISALTYEIVEPPGPNVAGIEVALHYETAFFGPIDDQVFAPTRQQPNWTVDWSPDLIFKGLAGEGNLVHRIVEVPERGQILDRNGAPLATNGDVAVIGISRDLVQDLDAVVQLFTERFDLEEETVRGFVNQDVPGYFFIPIVRLPYDTEPQLIAEFEQLAEQGILVQRESLRVYPQGTLAAHVVGFLAEITEEELPTLAVAGYRSGNLVGRDGVEALFEAQLAGRRGGRLTIIAPGGGIVREMAAQPATPAQDVVLTIDARIQRIAEEALGEQAGAAVVMDPRTHEILALASYPRFDPNAFVRGLTAEEFQDYVENPLQPFVNRPVEQLYPPGSTFKVVTLAAGLEAGGFDQDSQLDCPAVWTGLGPDTPLHNWREDDLGLLSLSDALAQSCNPVFYQIGATLYSKGENLLTEFSAGFGFGRKTGIVGLNEATGVNGGPEWKRINRNDFWYAGDGVNMSIGQGFMLTTPLQITNAFAALATDGILRTPLVVQALRTATGETAESYASVPTGVLPVTADTLRFLQSALRRVITSGTGFLPFNGSGLAVAGKSGTAEDLGEQSHALFVAYANSNDPKLIVTVVLDDGDSGADQAGPIVRTILERTLFRGLVG